jgi:hypothetical protein
MNDLNAAADGSLRTRNVVMRPVFPEDAAYVHALAIANPWSFRWCISSTIPGAELFASRVWHWTVARFMLLRTSEQAAGLAVLHNTDGSEDFRTLDIVFADWEFGRQEFGAVAETAISYFFRVSRINKIYIDLPASLYALVGPGLPDYVHEEGRLPAFYYLNGKFEDRVISSAFLADWLAQRQSAGATAEPTGQ